VFVERWLVIPYVFKQRMTLFKGQSSWAKIKSPGGKLTALGCHPSKIISKAEELTYLSVIIVANYQMHTGA
jgi:hypothetical protein